MTPHLPDFKALQTPSILENREALSYLTLLYYIKQSLLKEVKSVIGGVVLRMPDKPLESRYGT